MELERGPQKDERNFQPPTPNFFSHQNPRHSRVWALSSGRFWSQQGDLLRSQRVLRPTAGARGTSAGRRPALVFFDTLVSITGSALHKTDMFCMATKLHRDKAGCRGCGARGFGKQVHSAAGRCLALSGCKNWGTRRLSRGVEPLAR